MQRWDPSRVAIVLLALRAEVSGPYRRLRFSVNAADAAGAQLRFNRCASFVRALNTPFIALSAADPSGGIMPIWRAYCS